MVNLSKFEENVKELQRLKALQNFQETLIVADKALVPNAEPFDCPICFDDIGTEEGVVLRECLHKICRFVQIQFFANLKVNVNFQTHLDNTKVKAYPNALDFSLDYARF